MLQNITLSADKRLIHKARERALKEKKSLNMIFREWLAQYAENETRSISYKDLMQKLKHIKAGQHFTRDEFNER